MVRLRCWLRFWLIKTAARLCRVRGSVGATTTATSDSAPGRNSPQSRYLTPEAFAALTTSEPAARTAWPADQALAGAVQNAPASDSKPNRFSTALG